jgi:hypothetical protein
MDWLRVLRELSQFVVQRKKYVLAPIIVILALMAAFVLVAEIPVVTPFIYALF